jgi:hypothetical protein
MAALLLPRRDVIIATLSEYSPEIAADYTARRYSEKQLERIHKFITDLPKMCNYCSRTKYISRDNGLCSLCYEMKRQVELKAAALPMLDQLIVDNADPTLNLIRDMIVQVQHTEETMKMRCHKLRCDYLESRVRGTEQEQQDDPYDPDDADAKSDSSDSDDDGPDQEDLKIAGVIPDLSDNENDAKEQPAEQEASAAEADQHLDLKHSDVQEDRKSDQAQDSEDDSDPEPNSSDDDFVASEDDYSDNDDHRAWQPSRRLKGLPQHKRRRC